MMRSGWWAVDDGLGWRVEEGARECEGVVYRMGERGAQRLAQPAVSPGLHTGLMLEVVCAT